MGDLQKKSRSQALDRQAAFEASIRAAVPKQEQAPSPVANTSAASRVSIKHIVDQTEISSKTSSSSKPKPNGATASSKRPASRSDNANEKKARIAENAERASETWVKESTAQHYANKPKPLGRFLKEVIHLLREKRQGVSCEEIKEKTGFDIKSNSDYLVTLKENPKVHYEGGIFYYKATYDIHNKEDLLELLRENPNGVTSHDLKDSYATVELDIQRLQASKEIIVIRNPEQAYDVLFWVNPRFPMDTDEELQRMWREVPLPNPVDLEKELLKAGLKLAEQHKSTDKPKKGRAKARKQRKIKLTNTHLADIDLSKDYTPEPKKPAK